ncbi:hypothetical protein EDD11_006435 [Mortierella claussenii]|nr:hypothetical protein EDD11_006435 [Mortierella claussenii]
MSIVSDWINSCALDREAHASDSNEQEQTQQQQRQHPCQFILGAPDSLELLLQQLDPYYTTTAPLLSKHQAVEGDALAAMSITLSASLSMPSITVDTPSPSLLASAHHPFNPQVIPPGYLGVENVRHTPHHPHPKCQYHPRYRHQHQGNSPEHHVCSSHPRDQLPLLVKPVAEAFEHMAEKSLTPSTTVVLSEQISTCANIPLTNGVHIQVAASDQISQGQDQVQVLNKYSMASMGSYAMDTSKDAAMDADAFATIMREMVMNPMSVQEQSMVTLYPCSHCLDACASRANTSSVSSNVNGGVIDTNTSDNVDEATAAVAAATSTITMNVLAGPILNPMPVSTSMSMSSSSPAPSSISSPSLSSSSSSASPFLKPSRGPGLFYRHASPTLSEPSLPPLSASASPILTGSNSGSKPLHMRSLSYHDHHHIPRALTIHGSQLALPQLSSSSSSLPSSLVTSSLNGWSLCMAGSMGHPGTMPASASASTSLSRPVPRLPRGTLLSETISTNVRRSSSSLSSPSTVPSLICQVCRKRYANNSTLRRHLKIHAYANSSSSLALALLRASRSSSGLSSSLTSGTATKSILYPYHEYALANVPILDRYRCDYPLAPFSSSSPSSSSSSSTLNSIPGYSPNMDPDIKKPECVGCNKAFARRDTVILHIKNQKRKWGLLNTMLSTLTTGKTPVTVEVATATAAAAAEAEGDDDGENSSHKVPGSLRGNGDHVGTLLRRDMAIMPMCVKQGAMTLKQRRLHPYRTVEKLWHSTLQSKSVVLTSFSAGNNDNNNKNNSSSSSSSSSSKHSSFSRNNRNSCFSYTASGDGGMDVEATGHDLEQGIEDNDENIALPPTLGNLSDRDNEASVEGRWPSTKAMSRMDGRTKLEWMAKMLRKPPCWTERKVRVYGAFGVMEEKVLQ